MEVSPKRLKTLFCVSSRCRPCVLSRVAAAVPASEHRKLSVGQTVTHRTTKGILYPENPKQCFHSVCFLFRVRRAKHIRAIFRVPLFFRPLRCCCLIFFLLWSVRSMKIETECQQLRLAPLLLEKSWLWHTRRAQRWIFFVYKKASER